MLLSLLLACLLQPSPSVRVVCFNADHERVYAGACPEGSVWLRKDAWGVHFTCTPNGPTITAAECLVGEPPP